MSFFRLQLRSLAYHWRTHAAVLLAVAAATAVLVGALVVGDCVRGSLRSLAIDRLGRIDEVLIADHFFRAALADQPALRAAGIQAAPVILLEATMENAESGERARSVTLVGSTPDFWRLDRKGASTKMPASGSIAINAALAAELGAKVGEEVLVRVGQRSQIPAETALGRKTDLVRTRRFEVSQILPNKGLAQFTLRPSQRMSLTAFVPLEDLQKLLDQPGRASALLAATGKVSDTVARELAGRTRLEQVLRPELADYGLSLADIKHGYFSLTSNRLVFEPPLAEAIVRQLGQYETQPVLAYLANTITSHGKSIPYSTISAVDFARPAPFGPLVDTQGYPVPPLADGDIVLNEWAADDLGAKPGDKVAVTYFEPESTHGLVRERTREFRLEAIVPIQGLAADRSLTPELPGITDRLAIGDWDPPFPFEAARVRKKDESYWDKYKATPKAFVSLATGRKLWASRFGDTTSLRVAAPGQTADSLAARIHVAPREAGMEFLPIRQISLAAAQGTTSFSVLFLAFSAFIVASTLMLVALVTRLGIQQRARELGVLAAVGWRGRRVALLLVSEGFWVALVGALLGTAGGIAYAWLMLVGLKSIWVSAISTPFLELYVTPQSLAAGFLCGLLLSLAVIAWTTRSMARSAVSQLVAAGSTLAQERKSRFARPIGWLLAAIAVAAATSGMWLDRQTQAGAFFGSGAAMLLAAMMLLRARLASGSGGRSSTRPAWSLAQLAWRSIGRNPTRSTLTIGLVAAATFLIVAVGAFRLDPDVLAKGRTSGSGGFAALGESDQPIFANLATPAGRSELGFSDADEAALKTARVYSLRLKSGDDASCLNLYQPMRPQVLGVPAALIARGGFAWAASAATSEREAENPWLLLEERVKRVDSGPPVVPAVLDLNTAMYSLHLWKGIGATYDIIDGRGRPLRLKIVGLLNNSILQGSVLISEEYFVEYFPDAEGYRFFLVEPGASSLSSVRTALEQTLSDEGFDLESSRDRLAAFAAVQNTYLSTFQALGGLGLLLGTLGLAAVELRSVLERQGELALMRAAGFRKRRLAGMVMLESGLLLAAGLGIGFLAALVAIAPHLAGGSAVLPWLPLAAASGTIVAAGLLASLAAVRVVMRAELLPALRAEH